MGAAGNNEIFRDLHVGDEMSASNWNNAAALLNRLSQMNLSVDHALYTGAGAFIIKQPGYFNIYNGDSSNTIPPYGVCLRDGVFGTPPIPRTKRPDVYGVQYGFFINDAAPIVKQVFGQAQVAIENLYIIAYDSSTGTPSKGDIWGPVSGSYLLSKKGDGFTVEGIYDSTNHYLLARSTPMLSFRGTITSDAAPDSASTVTVWKGTNSGGSSTSLTVPNVNNFSDCTIKAASGVKIHRIVYDPAYPGYEFDVGRTA